MCRYGETNLNNQLNKADENGKKPVGKFALFPPAVNIRQPMLAGASLIEGAS